MLSPRVAAESDGLWRRVDHPTGDVTGLGMVWLSDGEPLTQLLPMEPKQWCSLLHSGLRPRGIDPSFGTFV